MQESGPEGVSAISEENGTKREDFPGADTAPDAQPLWADDQWWVAEAYLKLLTHPSPFVALSFKVAVQWAFYLGPVLTLPLLAIPRAAGKPWTWFVLATIVLTQLAVLATTGAYPHYLAPAPLLFVLVVLLSPLPGLWAQGPANRPILGYDGSAPLVTAAAHGGGVPRLTGSLR
jgi:hypothetical protein